MTPVWAITPEKIEQAVRKIVDFEQPKRVILFGSAARGETNINSDADFLVVTRGEVKSPRKESVLIRQALRGLMMPMDILVISEERLRELADQPGLVYREALRNGKVVYEAAA
jgi:predicted nucleotidyltransferase